MRYRSGVPKRPATAVSIAAKSSWSFPMPQPGHGMLPSDLPTPRTLNVVYAVPGGAWDANRAPGMCATRTLVCQGTRNMEHEHSNLGAVIGSPPLRAAVTTRRIPKRVSAARAGAARLVSGVGVELSELFSGRPRSASDRGRYIRASMRTPSAPGIRR
jgi:hypothetical protein